MKKRPSRDERCIHIYTYIYTIYMNVVEKRSSSELHLDDDFPIHYILLSIECKRKKKKKNIWNNIENVIYFENEKRNGK